MFPLQISMAIFIMPLDGNVGMCIENFVVVLYCAEEFRQKCKEICIN